MLRNSVTADTSGADNDYKTLGVGFPAAGGAYPAAIGALIHSAQNGTWGADILFSTRGTGGGYIQERMRIVTGGNIGIGTTSPQTKLEVVNTSSGATADQLYLSNLASATSTASRLSFRTQDTINNTGTSTAAITSILQQNFNTGKGDLAFSVLNSGALTEALRITNTGNVGIGTTSPGSLLSVAGNAYLSGFYDTSGTTGGYKIDGNLILQASSTNFSTAVGKGALTSNTTGISNTAVGENALAVNTANYNTAIGYQALYDNTTGAWNTGVGVNALQNNISGGQNTALGVGSLNANTTGSNNTALGEEILFNSITGSDNTASGYTALYYNKSATSTSAFGVGAGYGAAAYSNQGGTYLGYKSGYSAGTNSDYNTFLGYQSGYGVTTGSNNIWIGTATSSTDIANLVSGSQNILIGNNISLPSATASGQLNIGNIIYGTGITGIGSTISTGNVGIGTTSPYSLLSISNNFNTAANTPLFTIASTTGGTSTSTLMTVLASGNVGIGTTSPTEILGVEGRIYVGGTGTSTIQNNLYVMGTLRATVSYVGDLFFANNFSFTEGNLSDSVQKLLLKNQFGSTTIAFADNGNVGIGTTSPDMLLTVGGAAQVGSVAHFENSTGSCYINPTTGLVCSSDVRLKKNITTLSALVASSTQATSTILAALSQLNPVTYNWNSEATDTLTHTGFIAQEVQPILPDLVAQAPDGFLTMNYAGLTSYLVKAIQELIQKIGDFAERIVTKELVAKNITVDTIQFQTASGETVSTQKLCIDGTCITGDQLRALLAGAADSNSASSTPQADTSTGSSVPTILINGLNPANLTVGDTFGDLGAIITGPTQADINLGIHTFLNGVEMQTVQIDTSVAGTHTIDYVATNASGAATSTRTVIVSAPASTVLPVDAATSTATTTASN